MNDVSAQKTLSQWMDDEDLTDTCLADLLDVRRQTVWRWRTKGHKPHSRERKKIDKRAGCTIVFGSSV